MTGYKIGMAEEAVIADLTAKLAECQKDRDAWENACLDWENKAIASLAWEAKLREALEYMIAEAKLTGFQYEVCRQAVNEPQDDTALKEYRKKVLLEVIEEWKKPYGLTDGTSFISRLHKMAEE